MAVEPIGGAFDLGFAGEEGEDVAVVLAERVADGAGDRVLDPLVTVAAEVAVFEREGAAFALDDGSGGHQPGIGSAVARRRNYAGAKVGTECGLRHERGGKGGGSEERGIGKEGGGP